MEGFLEWKIAAWKRLAVTRGVALIPSILVGVATSKHQSTSDDVDEWLNILQSVQLPFALLPVLHFTSNEDVMGRFKNGALVQIIGWGLALIVIGTNFYTLGQFVVDSDSDAPNALWFYCLAVAFGVGYVIFLAAVIKKDAIRLVRYVNGRLREA